MWGVLITRLSRFTEPEQCCARTCVVRVGRNRGVVDVDGEARTLTVSCRGPLPVSVRGVIHDTVMVMMEKVYQTLDVGVYLLCQDNHLIIAVSPKASGHPRLLSRVSAPDPPTRSRCSSLQARRTPKSV